MNNARQNAYAPVNTWDTVAPNVPTFNTSNQQPYNNLWDTMNYNSPRQNPLPFTGYSIFDPFGVTAMSDTGWLRTAYGTNTRRGGAAPTLPANPNLFSNVINNNNRRSDRTYPTSPNTYNTINNITRGLNSPFGKPSTYPKPNQNAIQQYSDAPLTWEEIAQLPGYGRPPQEEDAYQEGVWVANPEVPAGGYGGYGGGGSYDYFSRPSSPSYTGYGSSYYSLPNSSGSRGGGNGYYSLPSSPGYSGYGGGGGYYSMPAAPSAANYSGGNNRAGAPAATYYRGINSGGGSGYGGYAGGQSQRSAWYGALLQWNI